MYVIRHKQTKAVLDMRNSVPGEDRAPEEVFPDFDPETMEFGRSQEQGIPAWFTIEDGIVKEIAPPETEPVRAAARAAKSGAAKSGVPPLATVKAAALAQLTERSLELRRQLIPDYQMQNAALGLYDEERTAAIRDTVQAFRAEVHRLEAAFAKAKSAKDLEKLEPNFPTRVAAAPAEED